MDIMCRVCLFKDSENLIDLFGPLDDTTIDKILMECAPIIISKCDNITPFICNNCLNKLKEFHEFRILCVDSDNKLRKFKEEVEEPVVIEISNWEDFNQIEDKKTLKNCKNIDDLEEDNNDENNEFNCKLCNKKYNRLDSLKQHERLIHKNCGPFNCTICNKEFKYMKGLRRHKVEKHVQKVIRELETTIKEQKRKKREASRHEKKKVKKVVRQKGKKLPKEIKSYFCEVCSVDCLDKNDYRKHLYKHKDKTIECDVCHKMFKTNQTMKSHKRVIHEGIKIYNCEFCGKIFGLNSNFQMHRRVHLDIKNYKCPICSKAYVEPSNLKKHMTIHTKERPFECEKCGKHFALRHHLKRHLISIHENKSEQKYKPRLKKEKIWPVFYQIQQVIIDDKTTLEQFTI